MNVLIRVDGGKSIGMGHIARAGFLAKMLEERFSARCLLLMREEISGISFAQDRGLRVVTIPESSGECEELAIVRSLSRKMRPKLWVLDILQKDNDAAFTKEFRVDGCRLVAITDDSFPRYIDADLVINGNPYQKMDWYKNQGSRYLIGPQHFIMDEKYVGHEVPFPEKIVRRLLVTMGGSDHNDLVFMVLNAVNQLKTPVMVTVISSRATEYLGRLRSFCSKLGFPVEILTDVPSLQPYWERFDCAITAGGNTLYERISVRLPGVTICQLPRQMEIADYFASVGVNVNLGYGPELVPEAIFEGLRGFFDNPSMRIKQYEIAPHLLDGKGIVRVGDALENFWKGK